jgi:pyruvate dehydrogenase E1 component alpha subunit
MTNIIEIRNQILEKHNLTIASGSQVDKILQLFYIRFVESFIAEHYHESLFRCPVHLSIGQEAIAVGVCTNLNKQDKVISTHRSHAHFLAKGGDLESMFAEMMGKNRGSSLGRGGSMHLFDSNHGFFGSIPIVGSSLPIAAGIGFAQKFRNFDEITVAFQGDASFETGQFHESLNFISSFNIPILIVMENNRYSTYSPIQDRQSHKMNLEKIVTGFGIDYVKILGDDLFVVDSTMLNIIKQVRSGSPKFVELDTFRRFEHCGPNLDDDLGYRTKEEIKSYKDRDPINIVKKNFHNDDEILKAICVFESFLPDYIMSIYNKIKKMDVDHPDLTEADCFQLK